MKTNFDFVHTLSTFFIPDTSVMVFAYILQFDTHTIFYLPSSKLKILKYNWYKIGIY